MFVYYVNNLENEGHYILNRKLKGAFSSAGDRNSSAIPSAPYSYRSKHNFRGEWHTEKFGFRKTFKYDNNVHCSAGTQYYCTHTHKKRLRSEDSKQRTPRLVFPAFPETCVAGQDIYTHEDTPNALSSLVGGKYY